MQNIASEYNLDDFKTYITTVQPLTDPNGFYVMSGTSYTLIGMEYASYTWGYQLAIGSTRNNPVKHRALIEGVWYDWNPVVAMS